MFTRPSFNISIHQTRNMPIIGSQTMNFEHLRIWKLLNAQFVLILIPAQLLSCQAQARND
jgi:hypothetical protein